MTYRLAKPAPPAWNVFKTMIMIATVDAVVLWAIPTLIVMLQHADTGLDLFFPPEELLGDAVLAVSTLLVLWAGILLATVGHGTPFSMDCPRRLVISGPYAWLRTPMVTGTLGQIVGVGILTGSVLVLVFAPVVALLWNTFIRPDQEDVLQRLFGRDFELYRRSVRCWLPMRSRWKPPEGYTPIPLSDVPETRGERRRRIK